MIKFSVHGPFEVPLYTGKAGRTIRAAEGREFFQKHHAFAGRRGCYVFAMRAGRGITPTYVGLARKGFSQECFTADKLGKCNQTLVDYLRGTLVVFFVVAPSGRGRPAEKQIELVEQFLIQVGVAANEHLLNVQGTKSEKWAISGVLRAGQGRPSAAAKQFKTAMKIA
jgi:hypothetical protein